MDFVVQADLELLVRGDGFWKEDFECRSGQSKFVALARKDCEVCVFIADFRRADMNEGRL